MTSLFPKRLNLIEVQVSLITNFLREKLGQDVRFGSAFKLTEIINFLENVFSGFPKHV